MASEIGDSENSKHGSDLSRMTRQMTQQNEAAYREFFDLYYKRLWAYLVTVSKGNFNEIEEAMQLTFSRVVRHIRIFENEDVFWNWLTRLARSAYIDCYRKQSTFQKLINSLRRHESQPDLVEQPKKASTQEDKLEQAIDRLDNKTRQLIQWKYFENRSYVSMAEALDISPKAVESRLGRARRKLKQFILEMDRHE